jgi:hypothetical protein
MQTFMAFQKFAMAAFDFLELITKRIPILHELLVQLALLGLLFLGIRALFGSHV